VLASQFAKRILANIGKTQQIRKKLCEKLQIRRKYNIYIITVDMKHTNYSDLIITKELLQGAGLRHYLINK
jgi:predicted RNA methylase